MKTLFTLALVLALSGIATAQKLSQTARRVIGGNTPPATCQATTPADIFIDTNAAVGQRLLVCTSANTWTPQGGIGDALTTGTLAQFASTTSAQLAGLLSDETGSGGGFVRATSPTLATPTIGAALGTSLTMESASDLIYLMMGDTDQVPNLYASSVISSAVVSLNAQYGYAGDNGTFSINYRGYQNGVAHFRDFTVYDGKGNSVFFVDGSEGLASVSKFSAASYLTATNCADSAGAAACGSAAAGSVVIDAAATSVVVSTDKVTANSQIMVQTDSSLGTRLGVTCNTQSSLTLGSPRVTARTDGVSFTITIEVGPTTSPLCLSFHVVN